MQSDNKVRYLPEHNGEVVFREPFPVKKFEPTCRYYIKASVNGGTEKLYRTRSPFWVNLMAGLIEKDNHLLQTKVVLKGGVPEVVEHTPQTDFLNLVDRR